MSEERLVSDNDGANAYTGSGKLRTRGLESAATGGLHQKRGNEDYTIGWICAITAEYVAAQLFLDEKHKAPDSVSRHDNNHYTLGRIWKHNVVIAVLPDGEYGISSAASVARDMLHSFPNVRIGLRVGVGGGAPSQMHDIRLGDIVVSAPRKGQGGVLQYDFGKTIQDQNFQHTGFLNQPPMVIRTAVKGLEAIYENGHQLQENIDSILAKNPKLQKKYKRPDPSSDRLYKPRVTHPPDDEVDCTKVCSKDLSGLESRLERSNSENNPAIHYGLIASANQLMKDALLRDKLAKEHNVLCFEMEAAGLMNHFPCLVIRGICDYSDTHKNKEWQGYAAMAAAAYAKDLLCEIYPSKVEAESRINDVISIVRTSVETMGSMLERTENLEILEWLTPIDYGPRQSDFLRSRQEGTGTWLLHKDEFNTWLNQANKTLFCPGVPGAGKTILTAIVIDYLNNSYASDSTSDIGIAYVYCNFQRQDEQKAEDLLLSLLKQFVQRQSNLPKSVKALYERHNRKRTRPLFKEIEEALLLVIPCFSRAFIIVDALDECGISDNRRNQFLSSIFSLQAKTRANIFATSRINHDVAKLFNTALSFQICANVDDVESYLNHQMSLLQSGILDEDLRDSIRREIIRNVDGMFLLAQLHMKHLIEQPTRGDIRQALKHLAKGPNQLDKTYEQAMQRINDQGSRKQEIAKHILGWIIHAQRPLSTSELQHALAVRLDTSKLDEDYCPSIQMLRSVCAGLVTINEESGTIRLVHLTTQQYFQRTWTSWFPNAQKNITNVCITYLSFNVFESGFCRSDEEFEARLQTYVLYDYAARYWGHHARTLPSTGDLLLSLLRSRAKICAASQAMMVSGSYRGYSQRVPREMTGVHIAAYFGLEGGIKGLLSNASDLDRIGVDTKDDQNGRTPLSWAAENGHDGVVKLLLGTGKVDVNSKDGWDRQTPLLRAAANGHEGVVKLLLETANINVDLKNGLYGPTPLSRAVANGHKGVVKLLINTGKFDGQTPLSWAAGSGTLVSWASGNGYEDIVKLLGEVDVNLKNSRNRQTQLWKAAASGHDGVVKLLLETGQVDVDLEDNEERRTPLGIAVANKNERVVKLLLETANVDLKDGQDRQTPLSRAAANGYESIVKLLLETGKVDVNLKENKEGQTPLWRAAASGHKSVVKLLLETGKVDVNVKDSKNGRTLLSWAAGNGYEDIVKLLLKTGKVNVDLKDDDQDRQTPLLRAAANGYEGVVKLLLETGKVDVNLKENKEGQTPLWRAAASGHKSVVKLLLETGKVDVNVKDSKNGRTLLSWAAGNGYEDIVKLLLKTGKVNFDLMDDQDRQTPLSRAAANGHEGVVKLLLETGKVDVDSKENKEGQTPLWRAAAKGYDGVVKLLLETGKVNVDLKDGQDRQTPLSKAAANGHEGVVKLLLETGKVDVNLKENKEGQTPLWRAAASGHKSVVKLLLETGKVNVNVKDSENRRTLLSWAAGNGYEDIVKLLLKTGKVNVDLMDDQDRQTPLSRAAANGHEGVVKLLLDMGKANVDLRDGWDIQTPLSRAAANGHEGVVKLLLETDKVDVDTKDGWDRQTPLLRAIANGHESVVKLLQLYCNLP